MGSSSGSTDASSSTAHLQTVILGETVAKGFGLRFWTVIAATFLGFVGVGAILPQLGPHVKHTLGASDFAVGVIIGVFSVVALLSRFVSGRVTDRKGRKYALLCGLALCSASGGAYYAPVGVMAVFAARVLQGAGEAFLYTAAATWVIDLAPDERRARALGFLSTGIWGGISVGPAVGHALGSYDAAALLLLVSPWPAMYALYRFVPDTGTKHETAPSYLAASRGALLPGIVLGLVNVHYPAFTGFLALHLASWGNVGGKAFSAYAAMIVVSRFLLAGLPDRLGAKITFFGGMACMVSGLVMVALSPSPVLAVAAAALVGFGFSFPWPSIASVVLGRIHASERASTLGVLTASIDVFVGLSAFLHGAVATRLGYPAVFWVATASATAAAGLGYRMLCLATHRAGESCPTPR